MTPIAVNRLHWPVSVLGPGLRVGVWVQGCSIGCLGCVSRDTWAFPRDDGFIAVGELVARVDALVDAGPDLPIDGVTISGGEPFQQTAALEVLLGSLRRWLERRGAPEADILVYTGYDEPEARKLSARAFSLADAVIAGPYRAAEPGTPWWGSGNQRLIARDERLALRYGEAMRRARSEVQVSVEEDGVFIIGIPRRRTLAGVESRLADRGIRLEGVSWRP